MDPDNLAYRRAALRAELQLKKSGSPHHRALSATRQLFYRKT